MKTIKEWAELCADDTIRKQWIENANEQNLFNWINNSYSYNMSEALNYSFHWPMSPQGFGYWHLIRCDMRDNPNNYLKKRKVMFHEYEKDN